MWTLVVVVPAAIIAIGGLTACSSAAAADLQVGDCLTVGGTPEAPEANKVECGSPDSNFKVIAKVNDSAQCPTDVDSYYSMRSAFSDNTETVCMDVDWVVDGCMSIDPENAEDPLRVDCHDGSVPNRQRAVEILQNVANVDQCDSGLGYPYDERNFTVCVEDMS